MQWYRMVRNAYSYQCRGVFWVVYHGGPYSCRRLVLYEGALQGAVQATTTVGGIGYALVYPADAYGTILYINIISVYEFWYAY